MLVVLATTCASRLLLTKSKLDKPCEDPVAVLEMVAELQLEIQSLVFSGKRESLVKVAEFINVEHEDQSKLEVAKLVVVQRLEEEIAKLKEVEILPYLTDVRKLLLEESSPGIKDGGKTKSIPSDTKPGTVSSEESVHKLLTTSAPRRQFKINGQTGEPDQKDKISFSSLARQIQIGLTQGYVESEIVDGVIRAITPGLVLRTYLETYKDLTLDRLKRILRSHYGVKNTPELYQTLASVGPSQNESPQAFLMKALDLKQQILFSSSDESDDTYLQYDSERIQRLFLRSVETGL